VRAGGEGVGRRIIQLYNYAMIQLYNYAMIQLWKDGIIGMGLSAVFA